MAIVCMRAYVCLYSYMWVGGCVCGFSGVVVFRPHQISVCKCVPDSQSFAHRNLLVLFSSRSLAPLHYKCVAIHVIRVYVSEREHIHGNVIVHFGTMYIVSLILIIRWDTQ